MHNTHITVPVNALTPVAVHEILDADADTGFLNDGDSAALKDYHLSLSGKAFEQTDELPRTTATSDGSIAEVFNQFMVGTWNGFANLYSEKNDLVYNSYSNAIKTALNLFDGKCVGLKEDGDDEPTLQIRFSDQSTASVGITGDSVPSVTAKSNRG